MVCDLPVSEQVLICSGLCQNVAHYKCVNIKKTVFDAIKNCDNINWFCDKCKDIYKVHVNKISELSEILKNIESHVTKNNNKAQMITGELYTGQINNTIMPVEELVQPEIVCGSLPKGEIDVPPVIGIKKKKREKLIIINDGIIEPGLGCDEAFATENSTTAVKNHTINSNKILIGTGEDSEVLRIVERRRHLFISRLHSSVTENDLLQYLNVKFNIDEQAAKIFHCNSRIKTAVNLDYSSFKISLSESLFDKLLTPSAWPAGTLVKEFENKIRGRPFLRIPEVGRGKTWTPGIQVNSPGH